MRAQLPNGKRAQFLRELRTNTISTLSLADYLWEAKTHAAELVEAGEAREWGPLFNFVRFVKSHPLLVPLNADEALAAVDPIIETWPDVHVDPWQESFDYADDPRMEFYDLWPKVKHPPGIGPVDRAYAHAVRRPLAPAVCISERYGLFVSVAGYLQRDAGEKPIFFASDQFTRLLFVSRTMLSKYKACAVRHGILVQLAKGKFRGGADEFRFRLSLFDFETGAQIRAAAPTISG